MLCALAASQLGSSNQAATQCEDGHNHDHSARALDEVSEAELFEASELPDVFIGKADPKITTIEYAFIA